jgi:hypothetical protein
VVDKKWWKHTKAANRVHRNREFIQQHEGVHGQWVMAGGNQQGGHPRIEVEIAPGHERAKRKIPDQAKGVPIDKVVREHNVEEHSAPCFYQEADYGDAPPGGAIIGPSDGRTAGGTMGPRMLDAQSGEEFIGTNAHVAGVCSGDRSGVELDHPRLQNSPAAYVRPNLVLDELDFAPGDTRFFKNGTLQKFSSPRSKVVKEGEAGNPSNWYRIAGTYSLSGLEGVQRYGGGVRKAGQRTCETYGDHTAYGKKQAGYSCADIRRRQIRWGAENDSDSGDSGSPVFDNYDTTYWKVLGLISGSSSGGFFGNGYVFGPSGYGIFKESGDRFYFADNT